MSESSCFGYCSCGVLQFSPKAAFSAAATDLKFLFVLASCVGDTVHSFMYLHGHVASASCGGMYKPGSSTHVVGPFDIYFPCSYFHFYWCHTFVFVTSACNSKRISLLNVINWMRYGKVMHLHMERANAKVCWRRIIFTST